MLSKVCVMNFSLKRPSTNWLLWAQIYKRHSPCLPGACLGSLPLCNLRGGPGVPALPHPCRSLSSSLHGQPGSLWRSASIRCYTVLVVELFLPPSSLLRTATLYFVQFIVFLFSFNELEIFSSYFPLFSKLILQTRGCLTCLLSSCFLQHSLAGDGNKIGDSQDCVWHSGRPCPTVVGALPGREVRFGCKIRHVLTKQETKVSYPQWCFGRKFNSCSWILHMWVKAALQRPVHPAVYVPSPPVCFPC